MFIELVMLSNYLILCHPILLLPRIFPNIRFIFSELGCCVRWSQYRSFNFSISPSNEYLGLIYFRIDLFDLLTAQGTLKNLLQDYNLKASIIWHSAFFMVQLSHLYRTTRETIALTIWTFVGKVMFLLFKTLSRLVVTFLPRSKCLSVSWLQSPPTVILEPKKIKSVAAFTIFHLSTCRELMGRAAMILVF